MCQSAFETFRHSSIPLARSIHHEPGVSAKPYMQHGSRQIHEQTHWQTHWQAYWQVVESLPFFITIVVRPLVGHETEPANRRVGI